MLTQKKRKVNYVYVVESEGRRERRGKRIGKGRVCVSCAHMATFVWECLFMCVPVLVGKQQA